MSWLSPPRAVAQDQEQRIPRAGRCASTMYVELVLNGNYRRRVRADPEARVVACRKARERSRGPRGSGRERARRPLVVWNIRRPGMHPLEGAIFIGSLAIAWLDASLAH